jgi:hypothetical protein
MLRSFCIMGKALVYYDIVHSEPTVVTKELRNPELITTIPPITLLVTLKHLNFIKVRILYSSTNFLIICCSAVRNRPRMNRA